MTRRYTFSSRGSQLVVTETHAVSEQFTRFVSAMAIVKQASQSEVLDNWFNDPELRPISEIILDKVNVYEMASHIMYALVAPVGEFELADTAEDYAAQVGFWQEGVPDEAFTEFKIAAASALDLDGEGARKHFQRAAQLAGWD